MRQAISGWRLLLIAIAVSGSTAVAEAACLDEPQGDGRVDAIIDARTFRLGDGREIRLSAIEPLPGQDGASLAALIAGREVRLHGPDDAPDRYGRQPAFVFVENSEVPVQAELLRQGQALFSGLIADRACASDLAQAEAAARKAHLGVWSDGTALKNAERPGDISTLSGRFVVIEGRVLSVRQSGSTFYVNFGRRWTESFAATISRRMIAALEAVGLAPMSLQNRLVRVRGWVELRGGPRIDILQVGQIELAGEK